MAPVPGSFVFSHSVTSCAFALGGLSGSGNIALQNDAAAPVGIALSVGGNGGSTLYSGALSGLGSLTKTGGGTLVLSGSNSYTGGTTVNDGVLSVTTTAGLPGYSSTSTVTVNNGGMLALSVGGTGGWSANAVNSLVGSNGNGFAAGSALGMDTTLATSGSFPYGYAISGSMGLTKLGPNALTLTASNTYTGPTTISGGTLQLGDGNGHDGSLTSTSITDNAALVYNLSGSQTYSGVISGFGSLTKLGTNALVLTGSNTYTGGTTITGGTLQLGDGNGNDGSLAAIGGITDNAALVYNLNGSQNYAGSISGSGSLTKTGTGTLTLSGSNAYGGHTTVSGGTLCSGRTRGIVRLQQYGHAARSIAGQR